MEWERVFNNINIMTDYKTTLTECYIKVLKENKVKLESGNPEALLMLYPLLFDAYGKQSSRDVALLVDYLVEVEKTYFQGSTAMCRAEFDRFFPQHDTFQLQQNDCQDLAKMIAPFMKEWERRDIYFHYLSIPMRDNKNNFFVENFTRRGVYNGTLPFPKENQLGNQKIIDFLRYVLSSVLPFDIRDVRDVLPNYTMSNTNQCDMIKRSSYIFMFGAVDFNNAFDSERIVRPKQEDFCRKCELNTLKNIRPLNFAKNNCFVNILLEGSSSISFWQDVNYWFDFKDDNRFLVQFSAILKHMFAYEDGIIKVIDDFISNKTCKGINQERSENSC